MATAVVSGASSGIGKAIATRLESMGYKVIGIARNECDVKSIECDFTDQKSVKKTLEFLKKDKSISVLVNAAGFGVFRPHEEISFKTISDMVDVNLKVPMQLSSELLRNLKQNEGVIINITSIEALKSSKYAALYSATKTGLKAFSSALFEEVRASGVNVININPDLTQTNFFENLHFQPSSSFDKTLLADDIADVVENSLNTRSGVAITDVTIRPQKFGILKK